jgi:serine protease Do
MGSGFIIDAAGYIVTNNHVVEDESKISVKLPDGREFDAKIVGTDPDTDVALLKVDGAKELPTVEFGDDRRLRVGDWVVAVGNPFGLGGTVTAGIVSSIGRDIGNGPYTDYIQIDAPINQGNSGGPTFDLSGQVVGMNSAIYSPSGGSVGIGFAIPSSTVQAVVDQLKEHGSVDRGWLGVSIQNLTPDIANSLGVPNERGAIVASVFDNSPAQQAGFHQGDVVLAINNEEIDDQRDLTRRVGNLRAGDKASFTVLRDGKRQTLTATIAKRNAEQVAALANNPGGGPAEPGGTDASALGLGLVTLNPALRQQFNLDEDVNGVVVSSVDPDSDAADKGFHPGLVIVSVNNQQVRAPSDVAKVVAAAKSAGRDTVLLLVADQTGQHYVAVKIDNG